MAIAITTSLSIRLSIHIGVVARPALWQLCCILVSRAHPLKNAAHPPRIRLPLTTDDDQLDGRTCMPGAGVLEVQPLPPADVDDPPLRAALGKPQDALDALDTAHQTCEIRAGATHVGAPSCRLAEPAIRHRREMGCRAPTARR